MNVPTFTSNKNEHIIDFIDAPHEQMKKRAKPIEEIDCLHTEEP